MVRALWYVGLVGIALVSCQSRRGEVVDYWVDSSKVPCTGVGPRECLRVKRGGSLTEGGWQPFYTSIAGFDYVAGKLYHLRVRETRRPAAETPADGSTLVYTLLEVRETRDDPVLRLNDVWVLDKIGNDTVDAFSIVPLELPTLEIQMADNRVGGSDGCNRFTGSLVVATETALEFGALASTRMVCPTNNKLPQRVLTALGQVRSYRMEPGRLILLGENAQELLRYRHAD